MMLKRVVLAGLLAGAVAACAAPGADEGLQTEVALCRDVWEGGVTQVHQDACTEVIERTKSDRLRGEALNYRGLIFSRSDRLAEAEADFTAAIEVLKNSSAAYTNRANVYRKQGKYDAMLADLEAAKIARPDNPTSYNNHAYSLVEAGDYAAALPLIEKSFALGGEDKEFYDTYAHVLMGLGRPQEAADAFEGAMRLGKAKRVRAYQQALEKKGYKPGKKIVSLSSVPTPKIMALILKPTTSKSAAPPSPNF